jgi:osmotically inducible lipoprotein OsmB
MERRYGRAVAVLVIACGAAASGCSTWEGMSSREKATVGGAAAGGVIGNVLGGGAVGTVGGAAVGGVIGNQIEREREKK